MTSPRSEDEIFAAALEIEDDSERSKLLDHYCGDNTTLRASVEELLAYHDTEGDLLDAPAVTEVPATEEIPVIDGYQVLDRLGMGGFGVVYRATQTKPLRREVALKVLKPGMGSNQILDRFESERQLLASMNHPNIAVVYDAGRTATDLPYFAMEYVDGLPIDQYCDVNRLSIAKRLELLCEVCSAVQHAHQKGVVHRDLKPSNVLVTEVEGRSQVKVIDFGIAKFLTDSQSQATAITAEHQIVGTPEYMSPEQVSDSKSVDTRTDIYAIGVIAFKLLCGSVPLDAANCSDLLDKYRHVQEAEVQRPSSAIRTLDSSTLEREATRRQARPTQWQTLLKGDLDWIVLKALARIPEERYQTANELASDLECHLHSKPVSAGPPSTWYRLRKFINRNRVATVSGALVVLSIVIGAVTAAFAFQRALAEEQRALEQKERAQNEEKRATEGWNQARKQAEIAVNERDKARRVTGIMQRLLGAAHADRGHSVDYRIDLLDGFAKDIGQELTGQPDIDEIVRTTLGRSFWSFGDMTRATEQLQLVLESRLNRLDAKDPLVAQTQIDLAKCWLGTSKIHETHQIVQNSLPILDQAEMHEERAWGQLLLSHVFQEYGEMPDAMKHANKAYLIAKRHLDANDPVTYTMRLGRTRVLLQTNRVRDADKESFAILESLLKNRPSLLATIASARRVRASVLRRVGESERAQTMMEDALAADKRIFGPENEFVVNDLFGLSQIQRRTNPREAEKIAAQAVDVAEKIDVQRDILRARCYRNLATLLETRLNPSLSPEALENPRTQEAAKYWAKAVEAKRSMLGDHPEVARWLLRYAFNVRRLNKHKEAAELYKDAIRIVKLKAFDLDYGPIITERIELFYALAVLNLVNAHMADNQVKEAEATLAEMITVTQKRSLKHPKLAVPIIEAQLLLHRGEHKESEEKLKTLLATPKLPELLFFRASILQVKVAIRKKAFAEAEKQLFELRRFANRNTNRLFFNYDVGTTFVKLYDNWRKPAKARRWALQIAN